MLELTKGQTSEKIIVTLDELKTLNEPYYLFVFTHVTTKDVVKFIISAEDDESNYPERYNQFNLNTETIFGLKPVGEWHYIIYEQASSTNQDPDLTTSLLEYGKMLLYPTSAFAYTKYDNPVTYKAYNG